jgi:hypothetical protein
MTSTHGADSGTSSNRASELGSRRASRTVGGLHNTRIARLVTHTSSLVQVGTQSYTGRQTVIHSRGAEGYGHTARPALRDGAHAAPEPVGAPEPRGLPPAVPEQRVQDVVVDLVQCAPAAFGCVVSLGANVKVPGAELLPDLVVLAQSSGPPVDEAEARDVAAVLWVEGKVEMGVIG